MALDDILETIRSESQATTTEVVAGAEVEARRVLARAREEAATEKERLAGSRDDQARLERSRIISRARLDAAREWRAAREEVYLEARARLIGRIEGLRASSAYEEVLAGLLDEALAVLPEATTVQVDSADIGVAKRILAARDLDIRVVSADLRLGGVVVRAMGRAVDNSLQSRLERADEHFRFIAGELIPELRGGVA